MQTRRREFVKVSDPTQAGLDAKTRAEDEAWRDRGYYRLDGKAAAYFGDVYAIELAYEEAPRNSDIGRRAEALGARPAGPVEWFPLALGAAVVVLFALAAVTGAVKF